MPEKVFVVVLRRPKRRKSEKRSDPFYEFGSFGCTGCHNTNLLSMRNEKKLQDARLAFAQGGKDVVKLIEITPPIKVKRCGERLRACWCARETFRFDTAPVLVSNTKKFEPMLCEFEKAYSWANRKTNLQKFSSCFRSRARPLDPDLADKLVREFENCRNSAKPGDLTKNYCETMETPPPDGKGDERSRRKVYRDLLKSCSKKHPKDSKARC